MKFNYMLSLVINLINTILEKYFDLFIYVNIALIKLNKALKLFLYLIYYIYKHQYR